MTRRFGCRAWRTRLHRYLDQESTTVPIQIVGVNYTSGANFNVDPQSGSCFFCNRDLMVTAN